MRKTVNRKQVRRGFTLVELVVVVLVLGIVAAVAAPKMFDTAGDARESTTTTSLSVIRGAIELHRAQVGTLPGNAGTEADFKADLADYLAGPFPTSQLPAAANNANVLVQITGAPLALGGTEDWKYDNVSGEFIINTAGFDAL